MTTPVILAHDSTAIAPLVMISRFAKIAFFLLILPVTLGICGWQGWRWWSWASAPVLAEPAATAMESESPEPIEPVVQIQIPPGTPGQQIGDDLEQANLIRSATAWQLWTRWQSLTGKSGGFQAGTYALSPTQSLDEIAEQIWTGSVLELGFTVPEGWNIEQMAAMFEAEGFFPAAEFVAATRFIPGDRFPWLPANMPHLEGFLYPDTYQLPTEQLTPEGVVDVMLQRFEDIALPLYQDQVPRPELTLLEWVSLASIVEKESVVADERHRIAGVFTKRLDIGMRLESDPTVEYGLGIRQTKEQPLTFAQVGTPSPYNTYMNQGIPPTAIASPGLASLEATLNPEDTDYLFFVARYDGTHVFSRTLDEHLAAQDTIRDRVEAEANQ